jgi:hypothetical protein
MLKPTPHMIQTLADLWHATGGSPTQFVKVENLHHSICRGLHDRNLCTLEEKTENGRMVRYLAFTPAGKNFCILQGINEIKPVDLSLMPRGDGRERISISIQLTLGRAEHLETLARVRRLKKQTKFLPIFVQLMQLWDTFGTAGIEQLLNGHAATAALNAERQALEKEKANISELRKALDDRQKELDKQWDELESERAHDEAILDMRDKLIHLEGLLKNGAVAQTVAAAGPRQMNVGNVPGPKHDDDDDENLLEVKKDEGAGLRTAQNFINSMMALQQKPEEKLPEKKQPEAAGPKKLAVAAFDNPVFDDEDDEDFGFSVAVGD